jgi:thymidylate kinase
MIYIVEGSTCSGKSTFAKNLAKVLGYPLVHFPLPGPDFKYFVDYMKAIINYSDAVFDRFFYSELVYSRSFMREERVSKEDENVIEIFLNDRGAKIVFMNPPFQSVLDRFKARGDDHVLSELRLANVYKNYKQVMKETSLPVVEIVD